MAERIIEKYWKELRKKKNVVGCDMQLQKRIRNGKIVEEYCFVVHVRKKEKKEALALRDLIPAELDGVPTDVVVRGPYKALSKLAVHRPLVAGISIGHPAVGRGTHGWYAEKNGEEFLLSCAHVYTPDASRSSFGAETILQPGLGDGGTEKVAEYFWHKPIQPYGPSCPITLGVEASLNLLYRATRRRSRFMAVTEPNHLDIALARSLVPYEKRVIDITQRRPLPPFVAIGFGGSDEASLHCKVGYMLAEGITPSDVEVFQDVAIGQTLAKSGASSCFSTAKVLSPSAITMVDYIFFQAELRDIIVSEPMLEAGDSGSAIWLWD